MKGNKIKINDIKKGKIISIERGEIDDYDMELIPQKVGENLLLGGYIYDFEMDGFKVINITDITKIKRRKVEKFHDFVLKNEGIKKKADIQMQVDSWYVFFKSMSRKEIIDISLEREMCKENFFVGKIESVFQNYLELLKVDGIGKKVDVVKISYSKITLVSFRNRYSKMLQKYGELKD